MKMRNSAVNTIFFTALLALRLVVSIDTASAVETLESQLRNNVMHPRNDGIWLQYYPLTTALRKNVVLSDVITPNSKWENWQGKEINTHSMSDETAENYDDSHNHYQNFLSEVLNFAPGTNAVAIWGDSSAVVDGSKAWGGFFSARSNAREFMTDEFQKYVPDDVELQYDKETYDAQLIGIEVDVLNDGLPGVYPNMSKTGVQIVGFGNPNSMAIEVRSEDTDKEDVLDEDRRGVFESGIYFKNSIASYGRLMVSDLARARIGLDFNNTVFTEGAIKLKTAQVGTGIILNDGKSGEVYGGARWDDNPEEWMTLRAGEGGIRVLSNDNTTELLAIDNYGGIYLNGDVYVRGQRMETYAHKDRIVFGGVVAVLVGIILAETIIFSKKLKILETSITVLPTGIKEE